MAVDTSENDSDVGGLFSILIGLFTSPVNVVLFLVIVVVTYRILKSRRRNEVPETVEEELPKMKKRDFTLEDLKPYNGRGPDGRILIAVNGKVFDVTKGRHFYGPAGPYSAFAGRDASRGLATFSVTGVDSYDDLSDLNSMEMDSVKEWEMQFIERYDYVGKLLKPGQNPTNYSDEEEDGSQQDTTEKPKDQ